MNMFTTFQVQVNACVVLQKVSLVKLVPHVHGHRLFIPDMHGSYWWTLARRGMPLSKEVMIDFSLLRYSWFAAITVGGSSSPNCLAVYDDISVLQLGLAKKVQ